MNVARAAVVALALLVNATALAQVAPPPSRITTRSGRVVEGEILERTPAGYLVRLADGAAEVVAYADVVQLDAPNAPPAPPPPAPPPPAPPPPAAGPPPPAYAPTYYPPIAAAPEALGPARADAYRLELEFGLGYTKVNRRAWAGASPYDWEQMLWMGSGRLYLRPWGPLRLGFEAGYRYFWWYEIPYNNYRLSYDVESTHFALLLRFALGDYASFDLGGGVEKFDGFTDPAADAALRFHIPLGSRLELLFGPRVGVVFDSDTKLITFGFTSSLGFKI